MHDLYPKQKQSFVKSGYELIGHMLGASILFIVLATAAWGVGYYISYLDKFHSFPEVIFQGLHFVEYGLFGVDVLLVAYLVIVGAIKFIVEIKRGM